MKKDVAKWQASPDIFSSPLMTPKAEDGSATPQPQSMNGLNTGSGQKFWESSIDQIPLLDTRDDEDFLRERKGTLSGQEDSA